MSEKRPNVFSSDQEVVMVTGVLLPVILIGLPAILGFMAINGQLGLAVATMVIGGLVIFGLLIGVIID